MATVTKVKKGEQQKALDLAISQGKQTLAGGLVLPEGNHHLLVADKGAFGILEVKRTSDGKEFALPIVAGVITLHDADGKATATKITTVIDDKAGAKTLVVPDSFFTQMNPNTAYTISVEVRNGRKVVTNVVPADALVNAGEDDDE